MKKFLLKGPYVYEIRRRRENPYPEEETWFHSHFDAFWFLRGFWLERANMTTMREILGSDFTGCSPAGLSDDEVIAQLARRFVSGQLCVVARHDRFPPGEMGREFGTKPLSGASGSFSPSPAPPAPAPPPLPGPSLAAAGAQAQALKQAAKSGSPFCEA